MWSFPIDPSTIATICHLIPPPSWLTYCVAHFQQNIINVYRLNNDESIELRILWTTMVNFVSFACLQKPHSTHFVFVTLVILNIFPGSLYFHMVATWVLAPFALMSLHHLFPKTHLMVLSLRTLDHDEITHMDFVYELSESRCHLHKANDSNIQS